MLVENVNSDDIELFGLKEAIDITVSSLENVVGIKINENLIKQAIETYSRSSA